jgi:hypothetical protein
MPRSSRKKRGSKLAPKDAPISPPLNPLRAGMPALDSITGVKEFRKGKKVYRIIETNEIDEYEEKQEPGASNQKPKNRSQESESRSQNIRRKPH